MTKASEQQSHSVMFTANMVSNISKTQVTMKNVIELEELLDKMIVNKPQN